MTKTLGTMFTGGALFDVGATQAGFESIWGIEKIDKIADVARLNGFPVQTADVINVDFSKLHKPDHLHASPPCPNFSVAKTGAIETELDIAMTQSVCRALVELRSETFTLENVVGYRNSQSFKLIARCLSDLGYWWDATNLIAANFGVPQTRLRLWIRARRGLLMGYPSAEKWQGWYQAIEDLIPTLPDSEFAPWQLARLPEEYKTFMLEQGSRSPILEPIKPAQTITSNNNQSAVKAFIFAGAGNTNFADAEPGKGMRFECEQAHTIAAGRGGRTPTAFVLDAGNAGRRDGKITLRNADQPHQTVTASMDRTPSRAFIGRVVKMTIQALGRFQTVPDSYKGLTIKINGNGCPPLEVKKILETLQ